MLDETGRLAQLGSSQFTIRQDFRCVKGVGDACLCDARRQAGGERIETARRAGAFRDLASVPDGTRVKVAGLQVIRQRPSTAKGMMFVSLEDEWGLINVVVTPDIYERHRHMWRNSRLITVTGTVERLPVLACALPACAGTHADRRASRHRQTRLPSRRGQAGRQGVINVIAHHVTDVSPT